MSEQKITELQDEIRALTHRIEELEVLTEQTDDDLTGEGPGNPTQSYSQDEDENVAVDATATPGYIGALYNNGVVRINNGGLAWADGGDFVTISHKDTSSQASVENSNTTVIQDVTLDTYGHVTALASFDLAGEFWVKGGDHTACYGSAIGESTGTNSVIDLNNRELENGVWKVTSAIDMVTGNNATGALQIAGGVSVTKRLQADGFTLNDTPLANYWNHVEFNVENTSVIWLETKYFDIRTTGAGNRTTINSTDVNILSTTYISLDCDDYVDLDPTNQLRINGSAGATGYWDDGEFFSVVCTKGIITTIATTSGTGGYG